jgi:hypothetical protein
VHDSACRYFDFKGSIDDAANLLESTPGIQFQWAVRIGDSRVADANEGSEPTSDDPDAMPNKARNT